MPLQWEETVGSVGRNSGFSVLHELPMIKIDGDGVTLDESKATMIWLSGFLAGESILESGTPFQK